MEKEHCNEANCTCPKKECPRHGKCCECIMNHRATVLLFIACVILLLHKSKRKNKKDLEFSRSFLF